MAQEVGYCVFIEFFVIKHSLFIFPARNREESDEESEGFPSEPEETDHEDVLVSSDDEDDVEEMFRAPPPKNKKSPQKNATPKKAAPKTPKKTAAVDVDELGAQMGRVSLRPPPRNFKMSGLLKVCSRLKC